MGVLPFEDQARVLLVAHAVLGAALVGSSTHLVVWLRGYLRGRPERRRAVRRFAWLTAALFAITFAFGNLAYPIYKVRVRLAYLEAPAVVAAQARDPADGAEAAARAEPDGHTLLFTNTSGMAINLVSFKQLPYDPMRDFTPVAMVCSLGPQMLSVKADLPIKTVPELLFVCVQNAGRSQMAAALAEHLSARRVHVRSAGSAPADQVNPTVVTVLE